VALADVVAVLLEVREREVRDAARLLVPAAGSLVEEDELLVDTGARFDAGVVVEDRLIDRLGQEAAASASRPASISVAPSVASSSGGLGSSSETARSSSRAPTPTSTRASAARAALASRSAASAASSRSCAPAAPTSVRRRKTCSRW
jgi:hypothetical protein